MKQLLLSHSNRMFFNQCHKKYYWSAVQGLEPRAIPKPFVRGKLGHVSTDLVAKKEQELTNILGQIQMVDPELANAMELYFKKAEQQTDILKGGPLKYVRNAVPFRLPLCTVNYGGVLWEVIFVGELDGIVDHNEQYWVLERKFTTRIPSDMVAQFQLDDQVRGYTWAAIQLGYEVVGAIPDIIRCTKYPETTRDLIMIGPDERTQWLDDAISTAEEIITAITHERFPMSPHSCNMMGECPYKRLCTNPDRAVFATTAGYDKREKSHEEEVIERAAATSESH